MERQFTLSSPFGEARRMGLSELASIIDGSPFLDEELPSREPDTTTWLENLPAGPHRFGNVFITAFP
jgi:hypothetical protein